MPVFLKDLKYTLENTIASVREPDYLKGNIFQKVNVEIEFRSEAWVVMTTNEPIDFAEITFKTDDWIVDNEIGDRFADFNVGDEIVINGSASNNGSYLISEKLSDSEIRVTDLVGGSVTLNRASESIGRIDLKQDPTGISFKYGLIENSEAINFFSKVDGSEMTFERGVAAAPLTTGALTPLGKKDWQLGGASFENVTTAGQRDNYEYHFKITQELYIHPFYLETQLLDLTNSQGGIPLPIAPRYFRKNKCLKHVFEIKCLRELTDPNVFQGIQFDEKDGQTGWFDEQYNGGNPRFSASNFGYGNTIGAIDPNKVTSITFNVDTDTTLATGSAEYVTLNFIVLPETANDYQNRNQLLQENFCWDRAQINTALGVPIDGEQFGTPYQVFKNVQATLGTNTVTITADIDFGSEVIAKLQTLTNGGYMLAAYANFAGQDSDNVFYDTMLLDVNEVDVDITDGVLDITTDLLYHDQNDNSIQVANPIIKVEDEIVADSLILLDWNDYPNSQINKLRGQIIAKKTGEPDVILLSEEFNLLGNQLIGNVRSINATNPTGFEVNPSEIRYNFKCFRDTSQDTTTPEKYAYRLQYPFLWRWEYWEQLILPILPSDWYDTTKDFNGYNNDWYRLSQLTGWSFFMRTEGEIEYQGKTNTTSLDTLLEPQNYLGNADWIEEEIISYDGSTSVKLLGEPFIIENKQTRIEAEFEYNGSDIIDETEVYMVARLIPKEAGSYISNESLSSVYNREFTDGILLGDSNGLITISEFGGVFTGEFFIDHNNLIPGVLEYTLSVSINRNTTALMTDFGETIAKDLKVLEIIDFDPVEIPKEDNPFLKCCYPLNVLADLSDSDSEFKNDFSAPIKIFPLQYTATMELEKFENGSWVSKTNLNNDNYGEYFELGFATKNNRNYIGYKIDWYKVLDTNTNGFGSGKYRVAFVTSSGSLYSEEYCLDQFTLTRSDETVRINYDWNRLIGDVEQQRTRDFVGINWQNQIRLNDSFFGRFNGDFESESLRYQNGELKTISKAFNAKYQLELRHIPSDLIPLIVNDILMGEDITITDYNKTNIMDFKNIVVEIDGAYNPNTSDNRETSDVTIDFKSKYDNNRSFYS